jgi:hypothetical protein
MVQPDGCVMLQQPVSDAGASACGAAVPAPGADVPLWEQRLLLLGVLQSLLEEARSERVLWQEFRANGASLNVTLVEAFRLHGGRSFQIFPGKDPHLTVACSPAFLV